mgnify:CR=1 FL=1
MSVNVFADDHSDNSELVEKAKKINQFKPSPSLPIANEAKFIFNGRL